MWRNPTSQAALATLCVTAAVACGGARATPSPHPSPTATQQQHRNRTMTDNPLSEIHYPIRFDLITPAHIEAAADHWIARAQADLRTIAQRSTHTFEDTLLAVDESVRGVDFVMSVASHLEAVNSTDELRAVYNRVQPKVSAFYSSIPLDPDLWAALSAYAETEEAKGLTGPRARLLEKTLDTFRRHGANLDDAKKQRVQALDAELADLTNRFSQNVVDATNDFELIITDEEKLAGLPESARAAAKESAKSKGHDGWRFTLQAPSFFPVLTHMDDEQTRRTMWTAHHQRAAVPPKDNRELIRTILLLRREKAQLLGYEHFADLVLEDRMAKTGARARDFVRELREKTKRAFEANKKQLRAFAKQQIEPWDVAYFSEKQRRAKYDLDSEKLRPYFAAEKVLEGLFNTAETLFHVKIKPWQAPTWHEDVRTFEVLDGSGQTLGGFYVDLHPRETKRGGAWMAGLLSGVPPEPHLALFCANVTPAVGDKPALLTHGEVETMFHEFGHLLHHMLSRAKIRSMSGTNVAWDFVEMPSQLMENWCWERKALDTFARHHETGEPIPEELFQKMIKARNYRSATAQMRQLGFAEVDLALHVDWDPTRPVTELMDFSHGILQAHAPTELPRNYAMIASFGHLFSSPTGYAAGYYSYKWAEVLDADVFTVFQREGIFDRQTGKRFRDTILAKGDTVDPNQLFKDFVGRSPNPDALLMREGLVPNSP